MRWYLSLILILAMLFLPIVARAEDPLPDETTVTEETPALEETPVTEEIPAVDEVPVAEEPVVEEVPASEEPVTEEEPALTEEAPGATEPAPATPTPVAVQPTPTATPTAALVTRRAPNGAMIKDTKQNWQNKIDTLGTLTIENNWDTDLVAALAPVNKAVVKAVYVRAGESATFTGIWDDTYYFFVTSGEDYDNGTATFTRKASYFRSGETLKFQTTKDPGGWRYIHWTIRLTTDTGREEDALTPLETGQFPKLN